MGTSIDFSKYYKTISVTELLIILDNPNDYQPSAIEAAKEELARRQPSETELQLARQPLVTKKLEIEKTKEVERKIKKAGHSFLDTIINSG
jgi:hypothetical protein